MKKILLLQLKRIGDLVLTTPAIAALRAKFPDACISLVVSAGSSELLPAIAGIDEPLVVGRGIRHDTVLWWHIARQRYDCCIDFTHNDRSAFLAALSRALRRVTADYVDVQSELRALAYTEFADVSVFEMHNADYNLALLEPLGICDAPAQLRLDLPRAAIETAEQALATAEISGDFVLLHPGSARIEKFWEPERWCEVVDFAASRNLPCVVTGGTSPIEQTHLAAIKARSRQPFLDLSGKINLLTLTGLISRARLVVTVDSAPVHIAAALQTPQVVLYGPTNPHHWRPRFTSAIILHGAQSAPLTVFSPFQAPAAMNRISTEAVIDAMGAVLSRPRGAPL